MTIAHPPLSVSQQRLWLGHPRGVFVLAGTELWERFSYYGMTGPLVFYMVKQLLLPGHAERVIGLAALRHSRKADHQAERLTSTCRLGEAKLAMPSRVQT